MPKVSAEHSASQRNAILDAAILCFAEKGFHRTTMRDVMRASGMSAGALYLYFKSKNELVEAIAESRHLRERDWITSALGGGDPSEILEALVRSFAKVLADPSEQIERTLGIQLWAESLLDPKIRASVIKGVDAPTDLLAAFFRSEQRKGNVSRSLNCRAIASVLVAVYQGLVLQVAWQPEISLKPRLKVVESMLLSLTAPAKQGEH